MDKLVSLWCSRETIESTLRHSVETGKVMLYGSSFFTNWGYERAQQQLAQVTGGKLQILNHGFGGATVDELLYHYPQLVAPYAPSAVVIRSGYNDIYSEITPENTMFLLQRLVHWMKTDFPNIRVFLMPVFDTKHMNANAAKAFARYNALLAEYAAEEENVEIFDINPYFYEKPEDIGDFSKLRDVFGPDGLHLPQDAYIDMAEFFGPRLLAAIEK